MRKKDFYVILIVFAFINVATVSMALYVKGDDSSQSIMPSLPLVKDAALDGTQKYKNLVVEGAVADTGNQWDVIVNDDYTGEFYYQAFERIVDGEHCNIWVGMNLAYDSYDNKGTPEIEDDIWYFSYPWTSTGYPDSDYPDGYYLYPGYKDYITGEQLIYLAEEFDNNIHNTVTDWFGMYADRPGPLDDFKIQILVFNIRDEFFYSPLTAQGFIAGYFWGFASELNEANIFHMDTYQWWRRVGDDPEMPAPYDDPDYWPPYPNQYEGTLAHEFQHLINYDVDRDEVSWVDEGCSTLAEWVSGYGFTSNIFWYFAYWWSTSLVIWEGYLEDYGIVFLWTYYCYEHYGGKQLIWDLAHEQANGIEGWSITLKKHGVWRSFDQIFQDWAIANYLDDTSFAHGRYGYYGLDIPSADTGWWDMSYSIAYWEYWYPEDFDNLKDAYPAYGYNYPYANSLPYVVNYFEFYNAEPILKVNFDGADSCGTPAYSGTYEWLSGSGAWAWRSFYQTFEIPATGATLNFYTFFELEDDFDFGYVEVYDQDDDEWYTLNDPLFRMYVYNISLHAYEYVPMRNFDLYGQENPNTLPGRQPSDYEAVERWYAFTGISNGWLPVNMDLTPFADHTIEIHFRLWQDGGFSLQNMYVDDISIPEIGFFDDIESGENGWVKDPTDGWSVGTGILENDFKVSFIKITNFYDKNDELKRSWTYVTKMRLNDETEEGHKRLWMWNSKHMETYAIMVVANQPGYEHTFGTYFTFEADILKFYKGGR